MRRGIPVVMILVLGFTLVLGAGLYAQVKKDAKTGLDRIEGNIQNLIKDKSTLSVRQIGTDKVFWQIAYTDKTKITLKNKPAKIEDLKEGQRLIVLGKYEKDILNASRIDIRSQK
jgi:hypothetical protein